MNFSVDIATPKSGLGKPYKFSVSVLRNLDLEHEGSSNTLNELRNEVKNVVYRAAKKHLANGGTIEELDSGLEELITRSEFDRNIIVFDISMSDIINNKTAVKLPAPFVNAISNFIEENPCFKDVESFIHGAIKEKKNRLESDNHLTIAKRLISDAIRMRHQLELEHYIAFLYTNGKKGSMPKKHELISAGVGVGVIDAIRQVIESSGSTDELKEFYDRINDNIKFEDAVFELGTRA